MSRLSVVLATSLVLGACSLSSVAANPTVLHAQPNPLRAITRAEHWLASYYQNPEPAEFVQAVSALSRSNYFEGPGQPAQAIGFFSTIFAQNPDRTAEWLGQLGYLPVKHQRVLASALWYAGNPLGEQLLRGMSARSTASVRAGIDRLLEENPMPIAHTPVLSVSSMNLQWGAFLASGSERYIHNILGALGTGLPGIDDAARACVVANASAHPRLVAICRRELDAQPKEARSLLRAALAEAEMRGGVDPI